MRSALTMVYKEVVPGSLVEIVQPMAMSSPNSIGDGIDGDFVGSKSHNWALHLKCL